jgi:hypothetical protein
VNPLAAAVRRFGPADREKEALPIARAVHVFAPAALNGG